MRIGKIAITGGIAEGKSTVLGFLAEAGYRTVSADLVARDLLSTPDIQRDVAQLCRLIGGWDANAYRQVMLEDVEIRRKVNVFLHPRVIETVHQCQADFVEIPLLVETALFSGFERTWVVTCGREEQRRRLAARLGDFDSVDRFLKLQLPTLAKVPFADVVVRTNRPLSRVKAYTLDQASKELLTSVAHGAK